MFNRFFHILKNKIKQRKLAVLCVFFEGKNRISTNLYILGKNKERLDIIERISDYENHADVSIEKKLRGIPVYLHFSGAGILTREVSGHATNENLGETIPKFNPDEFFIQIDHLSNEKSIVTIVRKDQFEKITASAAFKNLCFAGIFVGISPVIAFGEYFETDKNHFDIGEHRIFTSNGKVVEIGKGEGSHVINFMGESRNLNDVFAISCGILASNYPLNFTNHERNLINGYNESVFAALGNQIIKFGVLFLLVLLLVNYVVFDSEYKKLSELEDQLSARENMLTQLTILRNDLTTKKQFICDNSLENFCSLSYFSDQLGVMSANGIRYNKIEINPLNKATKATEPLQFKSGVVEIKGTAHSMESYQQFLSDLESKVWIKEIFYQDYNYKPGSKDADFFLQILFKSKFFEE